MPIRWCEPFGMVLIEALACGTPVIGFPEGAATEIIVHGQNGFLVENEQQMADAVGWVSSIDPEACRASVVDRFSLDRVVSSYEALYYKLIGGDSRG
jgi:glycosyltransferase involved in cell wall biosynthesis